MTEYEFEKIMKKHDILNIKDCPFCGENKCWSVNNKSCDGPETFFLRCRNCGCTGPSSSTKQEAIKNWEERK